MEMVKEEFTEEDVETARDEGYNAGYEDGLTEGRDEGYDDGYAAGESANSYEYEMGQYKALIVDDLATEVENELFLMRELREANPDLQKLFETVQRIIEEAENL